MSFCWFCCSLYPSTFLLLFSVNSVVAYIYCFCCYAILHVPSKLSSIAIFFSDFCSLSHLHCFFLPFCCFFFNFHPSTFFFNAILLIVLLFVLPTSIHCHCFFLTISWFHSSFIHCHFCCSSVGPLYFYHSAGSAVDSIH